MSKEGTGGINSALTDQIARAAPAIEACRKAVTERSPEAAEDLLSLGEQLRLLEHIKVNGSSGKFSVAPHTGRGLELPR
jgi:hypothetical protein